jgi:antitoxin (DNA-binding transcriptional repressor) of toxin-antitoxin stability system
MDIAEVAAKVNAGEDVTAGYQYLDEQTVITTKDLTGKAVADIVAIAAASSAS